MSADTVDDADDGAVGGYIITDGADGPHDPDGQHFVGCGCDD